MIHQQKEKNVLKWVLMVSFCTLIFFVQITDHSLGLREMLLSDENQLMKPEHRNTVYQDMTKPITDYWINTSHNT